MTPHARATSTESVILSLVATASRSHPDNLLGGV